MRSADSTHDGASVTALGGGAPFIQGKVLKRLCLPFAFHRRSFSPNPPPLSPISFPPPASRFIVRSCCGTTWTNRGESCAALFSKFTRSCKRRFAARLLWQPRPTTFGPICAIHSLAPTQHQHVACTATTTTAPSSHLDAVVPDVITRARFTSLANCLPRSHVNTRSPLRSLATIAAISTNPAVDC
jgi:hypothetical protein